VVKNISVILVLIASYFIRPLTFKMPNHQKSHDECRKTVCILCFRKCKEELTRQIQEKVSKVFKREFDFQSPSVPTGICTTCRMKVFRWEKQETASNIPVLQDFNKIVVKTLTRTSSVCDCLICKIGR